MPSVLARQRLWALQRLAHDVAKGLPETEAQHRPKLDQPGDRILILRYLVEVVDGKVDFEMWGRLNPVEYKRLLQILPQKEGAG